MRWAAAIFLVWVVLDASVEAATIRGNVVAENGAPGAGAKVWTVKLWIQELERHEATTDAAGRFAVEVGPGDWVIGASLADQGNSKDEYVQVEGPDPAPVTIRLSPQGRLRGRLVEAETGRPIRGGRLFIDNGVVPVSDDDGRFEVTGLSRTRYHESFVVAAGRERKRVLFEMAEGPVTDLEIPVPRGGKVVGRVLDVEGQPVPRAFVGKSTSGSILSLTGLWDRTDAQGRFEYDGLPLGRTTWMNTVAAGFEAAQRDGVRAHLDGTPISVEFRLARSLADQRRQPQRQGGPVQVMAPQPENRRTVAGVVVDPTGQPVAGATVRWGIVQSSAAMIETKTDADGKFRLTLLPPGAEVVCVIPERNDLAPATQTVDEPGDQEIRITLGEGRTLSGVVRDADGTPFRGILVIPTVLGVGRRGFSVRERETKTDAQGRFQVAGLPDSALSFDFLGDGVSDLRDHRLELGQEAVVILSAAGAIRGKVVDGAGQPVRNFRVLLNASRRRLPADKSGGYFAGFCAPGLTYSADDGSFLIRHITAGSVHRVTILAPGHGEESIDRVFAEPLNRLTPDKVPTFELGPASSFQVRVLEAGSRKPIPGASVLLTHGNATFQPSSWDDSVHTVTDEAGVALFTPLTYSEAMIAVQAPGFGRDHVGWTDHSTESTLLLKPAAVVAGELLDEATGKPLANAVIHLSSTMTGPISTILQPGDSGRFRLDELPGGPYNLSITTADRSEVYQERITLEAGQELTRALRLSSSKAIP